MSKHVILNGLPVLMLHGRKTRLMNQGEGKKISLPEMNARINELLKASVQSEGVINLFSDINQEFSLFDPKFLEEISKMKEKNLAVADCGTGADLPSYKCGKIAEIQ